MIRDTVQNQFYKFYKESKNNQENEDKEEEKKKIYQRKVELINGELSNRQQILQEKICQKNKLSHFQNDKFLILRFLLAFLKNYFCRIGNTFTIIILIILLATPIRAMIQDRISYEILDYIVLYAGQLFLGLLALFYRDLYIFQLRKGLLQMINRSQYTLFQKFSEDKISQVFKNKNDQNKEQQKIQIYTSVEVCDIQIGDIILLKKGDICPADCLILDMKQSFCSVKNMKCIGTNQFDIKRSPQVTQILNTSKIKGCHFEYRKILSGRIEFVSSQENQTSFDGYIKLDKDPNGENINDQNLIFRGQEIMYTEWCVAIVLYVGYDCRYFSTYQNPPQITLNPKGSINIKFQQFFFLTYLFIIIFTFVSTIIDYTHPFSKQETSNYQDTQTGYVAATYFLDYLIFLPIISYAFLDLMQLISIYRSKKKFENSTDESKIDESQIESYGIHLNESTFFPIDEKKQGDICLTTHAIFSKNGALIHNEEFVTSSITMGNKIYKINIEKLDEIMKNDKVKEQICQEIKVPSYEVIDADEGAVISSFQNKNQTFQKTNKQYLEKSQASDFNFATQTHAITYQTNEYLNEEKNFDSIVQENFDKFNSVQNYNSFEKINSPHIQYENSPYSNCRADLGRFYSSPKSDISNNEVEKILMNEQILSEQKIMEYSSTDFHQKLENINLSKNNSYSSSDNVPHRKISNVTDGIERYQSILKQTQSQTTEEMRDCKTPHEFSLLDFEKNENDIIYDENDLIRDISKNYISFEDTIKAICVTHLTKTKYILHKEQFNSETLNPIDKNIQNFISKLGFKFRCSNKIIHEDELKFQYIYTTIKNETKCFTFLIPPGFNERKTRLCVIIKEDDSENYTLYVKEELVNFPNYIQVDKGLSRQDEEKKLKKLIETGQIPIAFCKRELDDLEVLQLKNVFEDQSKAIEYHQYKEQIINNIYQPLLANLELLCILGVQEVLRKDSVELVSLLNQSFIKTWMLTGDLYQKAVPAAYNCKILQKSDTECQTIAFDCNNTKLLKSLIKNYILILKSKFQNQSSELNMKRSSTNSSGKKFFSFKKIKAMKNKNEQKVDIFNIVISGNTFAIIRKDQYLYDHFTFLLYFTKNLVGYQFDQIQKAQIIENLKVCKPNSKVLSIGYSVCDLNMFASSDYSVEIVDFKKKEIFAKSNSIVRNMRDIIKQIAVDSKTGYYAKEDLLIMNFYSSFFLGIIIFFWNSFQQSYGIYFLSVKYIFWLTYFTPLVLFTFLQLKHHKWGIKKKKKSIDNVQTLIFIIHNQSAQKDNLFLYVKTVSFQGLLDGIFMFIIFIYQYQDSFVSVEGEVIEKEMISFFFYLTMHAVLVFKYLLNRKCNYRIWGISLLSFGIIQSLRFTEVYTSPVNLVVCSLSFICAILLSIILNTISFQFILFLSQKIKKTTRSFYDFFEIFKLLVLFKIPKKIPTFLTKLIRQVFKERDMERAIEELNTDDISISQSKINSLTLKFLQQDTENKYIALISTQDKRYIQTSLLIQIILQELSQAIIYQYEFDDDQNFNSLSSISSILFIIWLLTLTSLYRKYFTQINYLILIIRVANRINMTLTSKSIQNSIEEIINNLIMSQTSYINPVYYGLSVSTTTICFLITFFLKYNNDEFYFSYEKSNDPYLVQTNNFIKSTVLIFQISITIVIFNNKYKFDQLQRLHFQKENNLTYETKKIQSILAILMPKFIRDKIDKDGEVQIQEDQGQVSILFCEICEFEQIISSERENIVRLLDKLFRQFDGLCSNTRMQKIETVGKTYMAASGLKDSESKKSNYEFMNPVSRAVIMSFEMMEAIKSYSYGNNQKIQIRIGIHFGRVIAGVIGCHKPQFSLIGDTVNMASRVCSTGEFRQITISQEAYQEIKNVPQINFIQKKVFAKGKGNINTYQITKKQMAQKSQNQNDINQRDQEIYRKNQKKYQQDLLNNKNISDIIVRQAQKTRSSILQSNSNRNQDGFEIKKQVQLATPISNTSKKNEQNNQVQSEDETALQEEYIVSAKNNFLSLNFENNIQQNVESHSRLSQKSTSIFLKGIYPNEQNQKLSSYRQGQQAIQVIENEEDKKMENLRQQNSKSNSKVSFDETSYKNVQFHQKQRTKTANYYSISPSKYHPSPKIVQQTNYDKQFQFNDEAILRANTHVSDVIGEENIQLKHKTLNIKNQFNYEDSTVENKKVSQLNITDYCFSPAKSIEDRQEQKEETNLGYEYKSTDLRDNMKKSTRILSKDQYRMWNQKLENSVFPTFSIQPIQTLEKELNVELQIEVVKEIKAAEVDIDKFEELYGEERIQLNKKRKSVKQVQQTSLMELLQTNGSLLKDFRIHQMEIERFIFRKSIFKCIIACLFKILIIFYVINSFQVELYSSVVLLGVAVLLCIILLFFKNKLFDVSGTNLNIFISFIYCIIIVSFLLEIFFMNFNKDKIKTNASLLQVLTLPLVFTYILFMRMNIFSLKSMIFKALFTSFSWLFCSRQIYQQTFLLNYLVFLLIFLQLILSLTHLKLEIQQYKQTKILETRAKKQNDILMYLLPEHILSKFLSNPNKKIELIDHLDNVTFLFADIAGFTKYSGSVQPENVVNMLRILFNEFDQQCQKKNVYKIYTIGDCYVVIGTKNANNRLRPHEEARNVIELGYEMIEIIKKVRTIVQFEELEMRIGVHTGSFFGGVIGTDIVRYDIYGSDVMIANKMESNGEEGKIMVSQSTMNLLQVNYGNKYQFIKGNDVYIKNFNTNIQGYFIEQNKKTI